jgi:hypothetical protein
MSETAIIGIAGMVAALLGVGVGYWLQQGAESRRYLRDASTQMIALALEAADHMMMAEVERSGGPPADPLRPEYRSEQYSAIARVGLVSKSLSAAAEVLGDAVKAGIVAQGSADANERAAGRKLVIDGIGTFQSAVQRETVAGRWERWRARESG